MASSSKRKYCEHCKEFVSFRTYRQHVDLYFNKRDMRWETLNEPSDEENHEDPSIFQTNETDDRDNQSDEVEVTSHNELNSQGI